MRSAAHRPPPPRTPRDAAGRALIDRRYETLARAAAFLAQGRARPLPGGALPSPQAAEVRRRYVANCLGELDRFLHALIDEAAGQAPAVTVQRNAANKIALLPLGRGHAGHERRRLLALGRTRACLIHCGGIVSRADQRDGERMTAGWLCPRSAELETFPMGAELQPAARELADIGAFYRGLADRIVS